MQYCITCLWYNDNGTCERDGNCSDPLCGKYRFRNPESQWERVIREQQETIDKQQRLIEELLNGKT